MKRRNSKTRQSKDDGAVPKGRRKPTTTQSVVEGGKAVTNDEQASQLELFSNNAEKSKDTDGASVRAHPYTEAIAGQMMESRNENNLSATLEAVIA